MNKDRSKLYKVNQEAYAVLLKELMENPSSTHELAEVSGLHIVTVQSLLRVFKRHKIVHVKAWDVDGMGRDCTPVFKLGPGRNVARRKATPAERQAAYKARKQLKLLNLTQGA